MKKVFAGAVGAAMVLAVSACNSPGAGNTATETVFTNDDLEITDSNESLAADPTLDGNAAVDPAAEGNALGGNAL